MNITQELKTWRKNLESQMSYDTLEVEGVTEGETVFTSEQFGTWNISVLRQLAKLIKPQIVHIERKMIEQLVGGIDIDENRVDQIIKEGRKGTLLLVGLKDKDEPPLVIDGHHRLAATLRINNDAVFHVPIRLIPYKTAELARVTYREVNSKTGDSRILSNKEVLKITWGMYSDINGTIRKENKEWPSKSE